MFTRYLLLAARMWDADYPKDPDPNNWRTINGAKVHLDGERNIDGGAGGKFNQKEFGSNFSAEEGFSGKYKLPKKPPKKLTKKLTKKANAAPAKAEVNSSYKEAEELTHWIFSKENPFLNGAVYEISKTEENQLNKETLKKALDLLKNMDPVTASDIGYPEEFDEAVKLLDNKIKELSTDIKSPLSKAASVFTEASVQPYNAKGKTYPFRKSNYTKTHKDNAVWCQSIEDSHKKFDTQALTVWENAKPEEREAIKEYTESFSKFNEPLRGIEYGTIEFKGVGNIDFKNIGSNGYGGLKAGEARQLIRNMTKYIERSAFDEDVWLQRGCDYGGMDKFLNLSKPLNKYSVDELKAEILGTKVTEHGFMSCGAGKATGFDYKRVIFNIYAPAGTKMAYADNFSHYKGENEMILQRGTQFRVAKIEENPKGGFFIDLEVVGYNMQKV